MFKKVCFLISAILLWDFKQVSASQKHKIVDYVESQEGAYDNLFLYKGSLKKEYFSEYKRGSTELKDQKFQEYIQIMMYKWVVFEGKNLEFECKKDPKVYYLLPSIKKKVISSFLSSIQYIVLKNTAASISAYTKLFNFTAEEHNNLVGELVQNYCSKNISFISHNTIKSLFYPKELSNLPTIPGVYLNEALNELSNSSETRQREFTSTIDLFKAFCLWDNNLEDLSSVGFVLRNPILMSEFARIFAGLTKTWNTKEHRVGLQSLNWSENRVVCSGLVCRRVFEDYGFRQRIPLSSGSTDYLYDFNTLYCSHFKDYDYKIQESTSGSLRQYLVSRTLDEENLMLGQLLSILTGISDPIFFKEKYSDVKDVLHLSMEYILNTWSEESLAQYNTNVLYEESVHVQEITHLDPTVGFLDRGNRSLFLDFSVDWGEFDKATNKIGKLTWDFNLKLPTMLLFWIRNELWSRDPEDPRKLEALKKILHLHLTDQVDKMNKSLIVNIWQDKIKDNIVQSLINQLLYNNIYFPFQEKFYTIPLRFHYGPFALKYIYYRFKETQGDFSIEN